MSTNKGSNASRRAFIKRGAALSIAGAAAPWALSLSAMAEASAAGASDYKALVCVFLLGGNDYANTVTPYDQDNHARYLALRPGFAHARSALEGTLLQPLAAPADAAGFLHQYALSPRLAPLLPLFQTGKLGVLLNVGPLVEPTSKLQYTQRSVRLPPKLFSHNDQQSVWQSMLAEGAAAGWGGMMGDVFESGHANANPAFTCVNVAANAVFLSGRKAVQYQVSPDGSVGLVPLRQPMFGSPQAAGVLRQLITEDREHLLENEYNTICRRSIDANESLTAALASAPALSTPFPAGNELAAQLKMVARMIGAAQALGNKRQVFFVALGGFDTHDGMNSEHPVLLTRLGQALASFYQATEELGVAEQVTTFTASDFGRTMTSNGNGSDHGWGSKHFVLGGAVQGRRFYGTAPVIAYGDPEVIAKGGPDDVGQGRLLPTTSVEQIAATLGSWLGVSNTDLLTMLPNLNNFNRSTHNLGFV